MYLDSRSTDLLNDVVSNPALKSADLEQKHQLNRRQIKYSFDKINNWLDSKNLPKIKRTKKGSFVISPLLSSTILADEKEIIQESIPSENERVLMILLMLVSRKEELSLLHFTSELTFSKNTILNDLKKAQSYVTRYHIQIEYSRRHGYFLSGKEFSKRRLLISLIHSCLTIHHGKHYLIKSADIRPDELQSIREKLNHVETELGLKFTDDKIEAMPVILALLFRRIRQNKTIDPFYIHYDELSDTKEYLATELIIDEVGHVPISDRLFITLHLLTANVYWSEGLTENVIPELREALSEMLELFEKRSCIFLRDKEQLLAKLMLHTKPAYYRIKYRLTEMNEIHQTTSPEFEELHHIAKLAMRPLEKLIGEPIPDHEAMYLSMFLGGWLTKQGDSLQEKVKAVVVCPNGVSISSLMLTQLHELFPEFVFLEALSVRDFQTYSFHYDLVFSPIFVETNRKLFIISSLMNEMEKLRLRKQVMTETNGFISTDVQVDQLMQMIETHASIENKDALKMELNRFFQQDSATPTKTLKDTSSLNLFDLVHEETIQLATRVSSWTEAVTLAAKPLLSNQSITPSYVEAMLNLDTDDPYIVIGSGAAIPHADPEEGVKRVSMSLLQLKHGVTFASSYTIYTIVVIAAPDKYQHLKALRQLIRLSQNTKAMSRIKQATSPKDIAFEIKQNISTESLSLNTEKEVPTNDHAVN
ncbi:BglG family transcription antiterminator [Alkalicoccobacillus murimartini]|uniref:Ascorbate-specific PTS system EIIA component n=1 Tax=Alkalicoccobacillus murimartini TaxID=171685 RepID=A0ABT9YJ57_9BACI|nr:BglG family transcription antiterminator [Alkalicoccobacillus murimartini]MDQ0207714.1 transcriptional antiterminator/mannitol/fructose-specific phosphotransferase system IIA component (Ntr-type) [Alkalicoccobacillus murimartini]